MKDRYINELALGSKVDDTFVLVSKELRRTRSGEPYLVLQISDRTGTIPAYRFRPASSEIEVPAGVMIRVLGHVGAFKGSKRITADSIRPVSGCDPADFVASSSRSTHEMLAELHDLVASVRDRTLGRVLRGVFADKEFLERFKLCPGSQDGHHAYVGGLLEHTVSVASLCAAAAIRHPRVDLDSLVTAAILHDIGMVDALEYDTSIRRTDAGRLVGHRALGVRRVLDGVRRAGVKETDRAVLQLEHALLTHHSAAEGPASAGPSTIEALILAQVDQLDTHTAAFSSALVGAVRADERWTDGGNTFGRPLYAAHVDGSGAVSGTIDGADASRIA